MNPAQRADALLLPPYLRSRPANHENLDSNSGGFMTVLDNVRCFAKPRLPLALGGMFLVVIGCQRSPETPVPPPAVSKSTTTVPLGNDGDRTSPDAAVFPDPADAVADESDGQRHQEDPAADSLAAIESAEAAFARGDVSAAKAALTRMLSADPDHSRALFLLARIEASENQHAAAIEILEAIPVEDEQFGIAAVGQRADYLGVVGRIDDAIELWESMLATQPDLNMARSRLAADLFRAGRRFESGVVLNELVSRGEADVDQLRKCLRLIDPIETPQEFQLRMTGQSPAAPPTDLTLAWNALLSRRYDQARERLERLVAARPSLEQAVALLAMTLADLQRFDEALTTLRSAPESTARFPSYWLAIGSLLRDRGDDDRALAAYLHAMRLDPTSPWAHEKASAILLGMGRVEDARRIDERRLALEGPLESANAIAPGAPDDVPASVAIVGDLTRLGMFDQAALWVRTVGRRAPENFGGFEQAKSMILDLRKRPAAEATRRRLAAVAIPEESPEIIARQILSVDTPLSPPTLSAPNLAGDSRTAISFQDQSSRWGLEFQYRNGEQSKTRNLQLYRQLGGGVIAVDLDRDGWVDLYFSQAGFDPSPDPKSRDPKSSDPKSREPKSRVDPATSDRTIGADRLVNRLFRNLGDRLVDQSVPSGLNDGRFGIGVSYGDWNQDGWWDVMVGNLGRNGLYLNQGDGTFRDIADEIEWNDDSFTSSLACADVDSDGLPDLVEINYVGDDHVYDPVPLLPDGTAAYYAGPNRFQSALDVVWFGNSDGTASRQPLVDVNQSQIEMLEFEGSDASAGESVPRIGDAAQPGLGLVIDRWGDDDGLKIFVANDARPNQAWKVSRPAMDVASTARTMHQIANLSGLATGALGQSNACMGIAAGDFDRDSRVDFVVTNWYDEWVNGFVQSQPGVFRDLAPRMGLSLASENRLGFGVQGLDGDNDGWLDLVIGNGHVDNFEHEGVPQRMPTQLLINQSGTFVERDRSDLGDYFQTDHVTRCVVTTDINRDGKMDFVATDLFDPVAVLVNQSEAPHDWIQLELVATESERSAVGARVEILNQSQAAVGGVRTGDGYLGRNEAVVHFGIAGNDAKTVDALIRWPSGRRETKTSLAVGTRHLIVEGQ